MIPCTTCGRATRSPRENLTDRPGTIRRRSDGRCTDCYGRTARAGTGNTLANTAAGLDRYMQARSRRLSLLRISL